MHNLIQERQHEEKGPCFARITNVSTHQQTVQVSASCNSVYVCTKHSLYTEIMNPKCCRISVLCAASAKKKHKQKNVPLAYNLDHIQNHHIKYEHSMCHLLIVFTLCLQG